MRIMMREKNQQDRLHAIDHALQARADLLDQRKDTQRRAQEEREKQLKTKKKKTEPSTP